jgi:hypothetical protein
MIGTLVQFAPMTLLYLLASAIALYRRNGEKDRSAGWRRWRQTNITILLLIVAVMIAEALLYAIDHHPKNSD